MQEEEDNFAKFCKDPDTAHYVTQLLLLRKISKDAGGVLNHKKMADFLKQ